MDGVPPLHMGHWAFLFMEWTVGMKLEFSKRCPHPRNGWIARRRHPRQRVPRLSQILSHVYLFNLSARNEEVGITNPAVETEWFYMTTNISLMSLQGG